MLEEHTIEQRLLPAECGTVFELSAGENERQRIDRRFGICIVAMSQPGGRAMSCNKEPVDFAW